jgi:hypothetical protein
MKEGCEDRRRVGSSINDPRFAEDAAVSERTEDDSRRGHLLQGRVDEGDRQTGRDHAQNGSG